VGPKKKDRIGDLRRRLASLADPNWGPQAVLGLGAVLIFSVLLYLSQGHTLGRYENFQEGQTAPRRVRAARDYSVEDVEASRRAQEKVLKSVPSRFRLEVGDRTKVLDRADVLFAALKRYLQRAEGVRPGALPKLEAVYGFALDPETLQTLHTSDLGTLFQAGREGLGAVYHHILAEARYVEDRRGRGTVVRIREGLSPLEVDRFYAPSEIESLLRRELRASATKVNPAQRDLLFQLLAPLVYPNLRLDPEATRKAEEEARNAVPPVIVEVGRAEVIVNQGQIVDRKVVLLLRALAAQRRYMDFGAAMLMAVLLVGLIFIVFYRWESRRKRTTKSLALVLTILVLHALGAWLLVQFINSPYLSPGHLIPTGAVAMLLILLTTTSLAWGGTLVAACIAGAMAGLKFTVFLTALAGGVAGLMAVRHVRQRWDLARAGLIMAMVQALGAASAELYREALLRAEVSDGLLIMAVSGSLGGLTPAFLVLGLLPVFETWFKVTTDIKLLELSDQNRPLLRKLVLEAPGTYHHSIIVGNIAERAAEVVGANALLARVGAYYHDIGKTAKPQYFIENQREEKNLHDALAPTMSSLIIINHVKEGLELARAHSLPVEIQDIIGQHHGTTMVASFHHKAQEEARSGKVQDENFQYPGPKPQSREAALIMLSDAVESAARSLKEPTHGRFEDLVHRIINKRFIEGQLNECDLTLRDLNKIAKEFVMSLVSIHHSRIQYPDAKVAGTPILAAGQKGQRSAG